MGAESKFCGADSRLNKNECGVEVLATQERIQAILFIFLASSQ